MAGNWYLNLHSTLAPRGELRAQLIENTDALQLPLFTGEVLTLPTVLLPGFSDPASYGAELSFDGSAFSVTGATPLR